MGKINLADKLAGTSSRIDRQRHGVEDEALPKFQRLTRKETRVREDQYAALSALARRLMRTRRTRDERITENTLIRVAIDLLLAHERELRGSNETELRKSVTAGLRKPRTSELPESAAPVRPDSDRREVPASRSVPLPEIGTPALGSRTGGISP